MTIGIDLGDVWSHYCTLNQDGEVVGRGRFRTTPSGVEKWFTDLSRARIAMEAGTHSIWVSEQILELGHEVIVANVRELRAISHSDRKSDTVDAEKIARYARLDPKILRPISLRTVAQQEALTLIRARNLIVRLRTAAVNSVRGLAKPCGYRLPASSTLCFAKRCMEILPPGLLQALGPVLEQIASMTVKIKHYDRMIKTTHGDRVPRDPGVDPGLRCRAAHGTDLCPDAGFQRTVPAKSRRRLLPWPEAKAQPVWGSRPAARHHQGWQRLSAISAGRVCQPCARSAWRDSTLRQWGLHLASRGGKQSRNRAIVAVARKLAVLLHRIWATQEPYIPFYAVAA